MAAKQTLANRPKKMRHASSSVSFGPAKAAEMLHNPPGGRPLSSAQRGLFGLVASGKKPTRVRRKK